MSRFNRSEIAIMVLAVLYILIPVDLIPELITGPIGLTDDMAAFALIMATVWRGFTRPQEPAVVPATVAYDRYDAYGAPTYER